MPEKSKLTLPKGTMVPNHIAVVLDGNGRWARSRGLQVTKGHEAGAKAIHNVIEACRNIGVHTITLWGFSTENWKRPPKEVAKILELIMRTLEHEIATAHKDHVRFIHLGRKDRFPPQLAKMILKAEEETKHYKNHILNLALDYGGRDEMVRAVRRIVEDGVAAKQIDEKLIDSYLDTAGQPYPNPDLFIRTSGEQRTSGLLPWQMVYAEFYFEEDHLPDMTPEKLKEAVLDYSRRRRRFGGKDKVAHFKFKPEVTARLEIAWWRLANIPEGTKFREYTAEHLREQWGISKSLAKTAARLMLQGIAEGRLDKWQEATITLGKFYKLIKSEVGMAFEPSIAASLEVQLLKHLNGGTKPVPQSEIEEATKNLLSEVYRLSEFQAAKAAHLRALATSERRLAELASGSGNEGDEHWEKAEDYLHKYYAALKDRIA